MATIRIHKELLQDKNLICCFIRWLFLVHEGFYIKRVPPPYYVQEWIVGATVTFHIEGNGIPSGEELVDAVGEELIPGVMTFELKTYPQ